ncbi:hypothetical protein GCM10009039_01650 [Halocalculus aciditolerans]|uniref:Carbohydrate-binding/sugar hydrolysis domain-containing protein n=1 Tax=Halocalculus aciditolerans TaxID=1383812 RepID=A0A830FED7_9EURY|nr:hypothetical protein GCM10009039_01650 [Halocalculus aciditolerans]
MSALVVLSTFGIATPVAADAGGAGNVAFIGDTGYSSVSAAIDAAEAGDTVEVADGSYDGVRITKDVTLQPHGDYRPTLTSDGAAVVQLEGSADGATVRGFELAGSATLGVEIRANDVTVENNHITLDGGKTGVQVQDDADADTDTAAIGTEIIGNEITLTDALVGVSVNGDDTVKGNTITGASLEGIGFTGRANTIQSNTFEELGDTPSIQLYNDPASANGASGEVAIANALLADNPDASSVAVYDTDRTYTGAIVSDGTTYGSLQQAVNAVPEEATVTITETGTYGGFLLSTPGVTVTNASDVTATIDPSLGTATDSRVVDVRAADATIHGLTVKAGGYGNGISVTADGVTVSNNVVTGDDATTGVQTHTGTTGATIEHNHVDTVNVGVSLIGEGHTVTNNVIAGVETEGVGITNTGHSLTENTISTDGVPGIAVYNAVPATLNEETTANAQAKALLDANEVATVAFKQAGDTYDGRIAIDGTYYPSVQAALDAAEDGDTVELAPGAYTLDSSLEMETAGVTLSGAGEGETTIDASGLDHYGIDVRESVTIEDLTVLGPKAEEGDSKWDNFGIHAGNGEEYIDVTVRGVTVTGSALTELDLIGVEGATVEDVTLDGRDTAGSGLGLSDAKNVSVSGIEVTGNQWGGIAVMTNGQYDQPALTKNVSVSGVTFSGPGAPIYLDPKKDNARTNIKDLDLGPYTTQVTASDYRDGDFAWYFADTQNAFDFSTALVSDDFDGEAVPNHPVVKDTESGDYLVTPGLSVQSAVDAADEGDTVDVRAGTYDEHVSVDVANLNLTTSADATITRGVSLAADGATLAGFTVEPSNFHGVSQPVGVYVPADAGDVTVKNTVFSGPGVETTARGLLFATNGEGTATVSGNEFTEWSSAVYAPVQELTVTGNDFHDNAFALGGLEAGTPTVTANAFTNNVEAVGIGQATGVDLTENTFENNDRHVRDYSEQPVDVRAVAETNDFDGWAAVAVDDSVQQTLYGDLQAAVDEASAGNAVIVGGTHTTDVTLDESLTLAGVDDATIEGSVGFQKNSFVDDATVTGLTFTGDGTAINANSAGDDLTVTHNDFEGVANAMIHGGEDSGQDHVKTGWTVSENTVTDAGTAFRLWNLGDLTVAQNDFERLSGAGVSLVAVDGALVANNTVTDTTKSGVYVDGPFMDAFDTETRDVTVKHNVFDAAGDADTEYAQAAVSTGANLAERGEVGVHANSFLNTETYAVYADTGEGASGALDATLNWFGQASGPTAEQVAGPVSYDPFLTNTPENVPADVDETQQFGHDVVIPGDGEFHSVAFPAGTERTFGEVFGNFDGTVWAYDAESGEWVNPAADDRIDALDAVLVKSDDRVEVDFDFADANGDAPVAPAETDLHEGWNFVGAPMTGSAESAFAASTASPARVVQVYAGATSLPDGSGTAFGQYTFGSAADSPAVSGYTGYWVYVNENGTLAANGHPGMTASDDDPALSTQHGAFTTAEASV